MTISTHIEIDPLGQQAMLNLYIDIASIFELPSNASKYKVLAALNAGIAKMADAFPWFTGSVVLDPNVNKYRIHPTDNNILVIKDFTNDPAQSTFAEMKARKFPLSMVDEDRMAVRRTIPGHPSEKHLTNHPVFAIQANFIEGGLILYFSAHHVVFDMNGMASTMEMLSRCCAGEELTEKDLELGNCDRTGAIDVSDTPLTPRPQSLASTWLPAYDGSGPEWHHFLFEGEDLERLKKVANDTKPADCKFVSTDDALTALCWQRVMCTRLTPFNKTETSTFLRAVDLRKYVGLSDCYPGMCISMAASTKTFGELSHMKLGEVAAMLRKDLDPTSVVAIAKSVIKRVNQPGAEIEPVSILVDGTHSVCLSSWAKVDIYHYDFGFGLGRPTAIRRGDLPGFGCLGFFIPKRPDGQIAVSLCMTKSELGKLLRDPEWTPYSTLF